MKLLILIIFSLVIKNAESQETISCVPVKMNVLYVGIENPVMISAGLKLRQPDVSVDNGEIRKLTEDYYIIIPKVIGLCTVTIKRSSGFNFTFPFRVKAIPEPEPYILDSIRSGQLSAISFAEIKALKLKLNDFPWTIPLSITEFSITRVSNEKQVSSTRNLGSNLSAESISLIQQVQEGDIIIIDEIIYEMINQSKKMEKSIVIRIK